MVVISDILYII